VKPLPSAVRLAETAVYPGSNWCKTAPLFNPGHRRCTSRRSLLFRCSPRCSGPLPAARASPLRPRRRPLLRRLPPRPWRRWSPLRPISRPHPRPRRSPPWSWSRENTRRPPRRCRR
jgi:hypothetical protein